MENKTFVCIECPRGCTLSVSVGETVSVSGNFCPKGAAYAKNEVTAPRRVVTSTVRAGDKLLPVKTDKPVLKSKIFDVIKKINGANVWTSVKIGDIIIKDVDGEGANVVATKNM